jgi:hypothetical protein
MLVKVKVEKEIEINLKEQKRITRKLLEKALSWNKDYYIEDDKVYIDKICRGSHTFTVKDVVFENATDEHKLLEKAFKKIQNYEV